MKQIKQKGADDYGKRKCKEIHRRGFKNKELQEKITAAQNGYEPEGKSEENILEDILLPIAKETGYEFTVSEYRAAQREAMAEKGISEEELENVSGGGPSKGGCMLIGGYNGSATDLDCFSLCYYLGVGFGSQL